MSECIKNRTLTLKIRIWCTWCINSSLILSKNSLSQHVFQEGYFYTFVTYFWLSCKKCNQLYNYYFIKRMLLIRFDKILFIIVILHT